RHRGALQELGGAGVLQPDPALPPPARVADDPDGPPRDATLIRPGIAPARAWRERTEPRRPRGVAELEAVNPQWVVDSVSDLLACLGVRNLRMQHPHATTPGHRSRRSPLLRPAQASCSTRANAGRPVQRTTQASTYGAGSRSR